jgi:hypothetical protein
MMIGFGKGGNPKAKANTSAPAITSYLSNVYAAISTNSVAFLGHNDLQWYCV